MGSSARKDHAQALVSEGSLWRDVDVDRGMILAFIAKGSNYIACREHTAWWKEI